MHSFTGDTTEKERNQMRKIVTAVSAAALSLSMLASAVPALAVAGYDSAYAGESAFVNISPGQTQNFQVFFANTGTTTWSRGTSTQVDLAACLEDKVTCNAQDASEASWNSGWLSSTRYATTTQTTTAPGSLGTFSYNVTAPVGAAAGTYRFNGDLVLSTTGEKIHPEGYYQDATIGGVGTGAATITSISPTSGTTNGGTAVTVTGTGFVCTPAFPAVSFGGTNAVVTSCGATSLGVSSPAHATGSVTVTVTNSGSAASNGVTYTYIDTTPPTFTGQSIASNVVTVTYSELVCRTAAFNAADWTVRNVSAPGAIAVIGDSTPVCSAAFDNGVTTAKLFLATAIPPGAFTEVTLNELVAGAGNNPDIRDIAGNLIKAPQAQTATATTSPTGAPTILSASGAVGASTVQIKFSEPVYCTAPSPAPAEWKLDDGNPATVDPTFTGVVAADACGTSQQTARSSFSLTTNKPLPADTTYTLTFTPTANNEIRNVYNVSLVNPPGTASVTFTTGAADFTPPTIIDARMVNNVGSTNFAEAGDAFSLTFSEKMNGSTTGTISVQDQDGTTATIQCSAVAGAEQAACTWNAAVTTVTVTTRRTSSARPTVSSATSSRRTNASRSRTGARTGPGPFSAASIGFLGGATKPAKDSCHARGGSPERHSPPRAATAWRGPAVREGRVGPGRLRLRRRLSVSGRERALQPRARVCPPRRSARALDTGGPLVLGMVVDPRAGLRVRGGERDRDRVCP
jgi:hypothetical protein